MIDGVHGDSFRVVIDGNVDWPSKGLLDACARAASAGKIIDDDFFWCETYKGARSERVGGGCKHLAMPLGACNIDGAPSHYVWIEFALGAAAGRFVDDDCLAGWAGLGELDVEDGSGGVGVALDGEGLFCRVLGGPGFDVDGPLNAELRHYRSSRRT